MLDQRIKMNKGIVTRRKMQGVKDSRDVKDTARSVRSEGYQERLKERTSVCNSQTPKNSQ